jgi:nucleoside-diphosphate-sugar epimerase
MFNPPPHRTRLLRRTRVLVVGCGDVGLRLARLLAPRVQVIALTSQPARVAVLRAAGLRPLVGNLDAPGTLARLAALGQRVVHLAPPPSQGEGDPRTRQLLRSLARRSPPRALVYASTTGVYGDARGARFDETRPVAPATARARRRVDAEQQVRVWGRSQGAAACVMRVPGIYALDREGGNPIERVARGAPVLRHEDDVYTNHVHADDLARACARALWCGAPQRIYHVSDDSELLMGDYFDQVADLAGLPRPPRLSRSEAEHRVGPMALSFMSESRRLVNRRLKCELRLVLRHPAVIDALKATRPPAPLPSVPD